MLVARSGTKLIRLIIGFTRVDRVVDVDERKAVHTPLLLQMNQFVTSRSLHLPTAQSRRSAILLLLFVYVCMCARVYCLKYILLFVCLFVGWQLN